MGEQNRIRKTAYTVLRKHKIINPSLDDLVQIAKELGFDVIDYPKFSSESSAEVLIRELGLESFAKNGKSFLYKNNKIKLIFLCETMDAKEKLYALAHELGHIYCGHLKNGICCNEADMEEEHEANEFAHYLLHPRWANKATQVVCRHKMLSIFIAILIICCIISIPVITQVHLNQSYYGEYYVTKNGKKYHTKNCQIIKDKTNTHRLTVDEYDTGEYEPCQICLPNGKNDGGLHNEFI